MSSYYPITDSTWHEVALRPAVARNYISEIRHAGPGEVLSASTINRRMSTIRCFARGLGQPDPLADYNGPKRARPPAHPLPGLRDDLEAMIANAHTYEQGCIVALCGMVGCRIEEARSIRRSSIRAVHGQPYLRIRGKGDKVRDVPIAPRPMELLQLRLDEIEVEMRRSPDKLWSPDPKLINYSDRGARNAYTAMGRRAGIETATHDARMTFGTMVYSMEKDLRATQELLGHASAETTVGYTQVGDRAKLAGVSAFA